MVEQIQADEITGLILAGGQGSRMGGVDKGLQAFDGLPLAQHTLNRLKNSGGVGPVAINANRNLATYESFGVPVWPDSVAGYAGPLAGFLSGMERSTTPFLLTLPCDTPLFPQDLTHRLALALQSHHADIAMACAPQKDAQGHVQWRPQPVFCLLHVKLLDSLRQFVHAGGRKTGAWTAQHNTVLVPFDQPGDDCQAFANVNTLLELQQLQCRLTEKH